MQLHGIVTGGIIVLQNGISLPEGTRVAVLVETPGAQEQSSSLGSLLKYAGVVKDLPADMARNHDHYLHGAPKK